jgi:putative PIN family toxin of toxin-antitoxin system
MRVVPDTNVLARAARPGSLAAKVIAQITGPHQLVLSAVLLVEVARVLRYPRLRAMHGLDDQDIDLFVSHRQSAAFVVNIGPSDLVPVVPKDPDDDWVIATAVIGNAEVICTRDTDFDDPLVQTYCQQHGIRVMTDLALLNLLTASPGP